MTDDEFDAVCKELDRPPTDLELAMYSVMWSEHCSYKSSKQYLRRLPTEAPWVLVGPGEGAGVIDIGEDTAVALRIESHNHPSAVEPFQGAATGVGGIIRDLFSMGARPIALLDPLRFGTLDDARTRYLFEGVVSGISHYGNAVGVPTVGGEVVFDSCYKGNPLVNVACIGYVPKDRLTLARAEGVGNLAVLIGARTGRDGIGGASVLASAGFDETAETKRPSVQVGDPFEEKKLIEACLELMDRNLAVGVQDLGAAGISCASSEIAAATGAGMDVDVSVIPVREPGMTPPEIMISESQERMLAIVTPELLSQVEELCERWEVRCTVIGRVSDTGRYRVYDGLFAAEQAGLPIPEPIADVPIGSMGHGPEYDRPAAPPSDLAERQADDPHPKLLERNVDAADTLRALLASPTIADKTWVYRQYDHMLFLNTVLPPGSAEAAVLRVKGTSKAIAISTDGKARFCARDPRTGGKLVVLEAARNVACTGAVPRALVNCLNFGNPEHPEVMWQFSEVIEGMREACEALELPVVGGNVSFYNESNGSDIDPTPVVAVVGVIDDLAAVPPALTWNEGDLVYLLGSTGSEFGGSELANMHGLNGGMPPAADLELANALGKVLRGIGPHISGLHDLSDGGFAVALSELAIMTGIGCTITAPSAPELLSALFSESASRVLVAVPATSRAAFEAVLADTAVPVEHLGVVGGDRVVIEAALDLAVAELTEIWRTAIPNLLAGDTSPAIP